MGRDYSIRTYCTSFHSLAILWSTSATQRHSDQRGGWRGTHPLPRLSVLVINLGASSSFAFHCRRTTRTLQGGSGHRRNKVSIHTRTASSFRSVPASATALLAASAGIAILASPPSHQRWRGATNGYFLGCCRHQMVVKAPQRLTHAPAACHGPSSRPRDIVSYSYPTDHVRILTST